jgi:uncharacterized repeat protein (TIGR04052 family)
MITLKRVFMAAIICSFFISGCNGSDQPTNKEITFQPTFNGNNINCNSAIIYSSSEWHYSQLQFFISSIELKNKTGIWKKASLAKSPYQTNQSALLGEHCSSSNIKSKAQWSLIFEENSALTNAVAIRFDLGLPFAVNHLNPLTQESPLNIPTMFWGWQKGHKFLRLEMASNADNWLFHLGSVGCKAPSPMRSPKSECLYPNRYTYELPLNNSNSQILFNLSALLSNVLITEQTSCQSSPDKASCIVLFENLNKTNAQSVFQLKSKI